MTDIPVDLAPESDSDERRDGPGLSDLLLIQTIEPLVLDLIESGAREVEEIAAAGRLAVFAAQVERALERAPKAPVARLAMGLAQERLHDLSAAGSTFLTLSRDLIQAGKWDAARALAQRGLRDRPDHRFVDLMINTLPKIAPAEVAEEAFAEDLALCRELCPTAPEFLWHECRTADAAGDRLLAERLAAKAFEAYIALDEAALAEDPLLRALESDCAEVLSALIATFPKMARAKQKDLLEVTLDLGLARLREAGLTGELVRVFQEILDRYEAPPVVRKLYVECLTDSLGGKQAVGGLVEAAGLPDPAVPINDALRRLDRLTKLLPGTFLPGVHVFERESGVGKVVGHDGKFLTVDFRDQRGRRMSLEIAERALVIAPESLVSVQWFEHPEILGREKTSDPVALVVRALTQLGGEATHKQIKETLCGSAITPAEWASWWKKARDQAVRDPRIDQAHAFRDTMRLGSPDAPRAESARLELPHLDSRAGLKKTARTVTRLLEQHPEAEEAARSAYAETLALLMPEERSAEARLSVLPLLARWLPERRAEWVSEADRCIASGGAVTDVADEAAQKDVLALAFEGEAWLAAGGAALTSRYASVRELAWTALAERAGADLGHVLVDLLTSGLGQAQSVLLAVQILERWPSLGAAGQPDPWAVLIAIAPSLHLTAPTKTRETALSLVAPDGRLAELLRDVAGPAGTARVRLTPALRLAGVAAVEPLEKLFQATGHDTLADRLPGREHDEDEGPLPPERDDRVTLMTRASYDVMRTRLSTMRGQLEQVLRELKIARELGDISENADYDAAREQQGMLVSTIASTQRSIQSAMFLEDLERADGVVRPGCEVCYRDCGSGEERTIWLLGIGDEHWGPDVVSYRAPVGQALVGHKVGEVVEMALGEEITRIEVVSVATRLP